MGDMALVEVVAEPGDALFEAQRGESAVAHGPTPEGANLFGQDLPERREVVAHDKEFGAGNSTGGTAGDAAAQRAHRGVDGRKSAERGKIDARELRERFGSLRSFEGQGPEEIDLIGEIHVVHDDVFVERFDKALADHGVGNAEQMVGQSVGLDFREDVPLRIQQERDGARAWSKVLDIVREDGVQVADAVGAGKAQVGAIVLVDESHGIAGGAVFGEPIAKVIGQGAAEPHSHLRAGALVHGGKRSIAGGDGSVCFHGR